MLLRGGVCGWWLGYEGRVYMDGISVFIKEGW